MHLELAKESFDEAIEHLKKELSQLRTGRATPAIVEYIQVEVYGSMMPLKGVASISVSDPKSLAIEPWDKANLKPIEDAIRAADIGINPINDGRVIRLVMPVVTEESRKNLVKVVKERAEDGRIQIRQSREEIRASIIDAETVGELSEDERFALQDKLETLVKEFNEKIKNIAEEKEKEIMTI